MDKSILPSVGLPFYLAAGRMASLSIVPGVVAA